MRKVLLRLCRLGILIGLLLLVACSGTTFVYNRLSFLLPWYVDDYAQLDSQQEAYFAELLAPFLEWHRHQELPSYVAILDGIEKSLDSPLTAAGIAAVFAQLQDAWLRLEGKGLEQLLALGAQLSDAQLAKFMDALWKEQKEYADKYLKRSDDEFYKESYDNLVDNAKDYLGTLTDEQRAQLRAASRRLMRSDIVWINERAEWLTELGELLKRQPGWQQKIKDAVARRREHPSEKYAEVFANNMGVIYELVAQLLNERTERQDMHLRDRLDDVRTDLETLIVEGEHSQHDPVK